MYLFILFNFIKKNFFLRDKELWFNDLSAWRSGMTGLIISTVTLWQMRLFGSMTEYLSP